MMNHYYWKSMLVGWLTPCAVIIWASLMSVAKTLLKWSENRVELWPFPQPTSKAIFNGPVYFVNKW